VKSATSHLDQWTLKLDAPELQPDSGLRPSLLHLPVTSNYRKHILPQNNPDNYIPLNTNAAMLSTISAYILFVLFSLSTIAQSCRPSVWAVGLSKNQTLDNHLRIVGQPISIQERRPEINGYTASIADNDKTMFKAIRSDESVGFVTKIPQDYFRKFDQLIKAGWDEENADFYEHMSFPNYHWGVLQFRDPEVIDTGKMRRSVFVFPQSLSKTKNKHLTKHYHVKENLWSGWSNWKRATALTFSSTSLRSSVQ
jgi:hypothetical protein